MEAASAPVSPFQESDEAFDLASSLAAGTELDIFSPDSIGGSGSIRMPLTGDADVPGGATFGGNIPVDEARIEREERGDFGDDGLIKDTTTGGADSGEEAGGLGEANADQALVFSGTSKGAGDPTKTPKSAFEAALVEAMKDYEDAQAGEDTGTKDIDYYKQKFSEATGIDTSGKVDKSQALMAFGLALMQNKAGKGFNVGNMLKSVGSAGEKAMPLLQKAKAEAKAAALSAGKYALEMRSADTTKAEAAKEKAMNRSQFYIYEKGGKGTPFENFDNGDLEYVSLYELDALMKNPNFNKKYSFMPADKYFDILKGEAKDTDLGNAYSKSTKISLLGGDVEDVDSIYIVDGQRPDGNYKGQRKKHSYLQSNPETVVANLVKEQNSILREQEKFKGLIGDIKTGVSIPKQLGSSIIQFGRNLGLDIGDGPTSIAQAKKKLEAIQLQEATNILKESGKTLSDQDRERVKRFVGTIDLTSADPALIMQSLGRVYELILVARQRNLNTAKTNLNETFGVSFEESITQEELDLINEKRKKDGLELRTMDDFK